MLTAVHALLSHLSASAQKLHDVSIAPQRASLDSSISGAASASAAVEVGRLRRALQQEQLDRRSDEERHAGRLRDAEERCRALTSQLTELRQKLSHSEHRVKQRERELEEYKERLRKKQAGSSYVGLSGDTFLCPRPPQSTHTHAHITVIVIA